MGSCKICIRESTHFVPWECFRQSGWDEVPSKPKSLKPYVLHVPMGTPSSLVGFNAHQHTRATMYMYMDAQTSCVHKSPCVARGRSRGEPEREGEGVCPNHIESLTNIVFESCLMSWFSSQRRILAHEVGSWNYTTLARAGRASPITVVSCHRATIKY